MIYNKRLHFVVIIITLLYVYIFIANFLIIPYNDTAHKEVIITFFVYEYTGHRAHGQNNAVADEATGMFADNTIPTPDQPVIDNLCRALNPEWSDSIGCLTAIADTDMHAGYSRPVMREVEATEPAETGRQAQSRTLLTAEGVFKALAGLSLRDRLWIIGIVSRCSIDQLLQIKSMLEGGVTWEENKAMFNILREKVTAEEQAKLDRLIELYTR